MDEKLAKLVANLADKIGQNAPPQVKHIARPALPIRGNLTQADKWESLMWMVDTASAHGPKALTGLVLALSRIIQAKVFEDYFINARPNGSANTEVNDLLWDHELKCLPDGRCISQILAPSKRKVSVNIQDSAVFPNVWEPWRLARAMENIGPKSTCGKWRQDHNHHAFAWLPWPLIWVYNGNHSVTAGMLRGGGKLRCDITYDASPLLKCVRTDGLKWFPMEGTKAFAKVQSLPMAAIFVIGQRLIELQRPAVAH